MEEQSEQEKSEKWKKETSAGGLVFKRENMRAYVLLIKPFSRDWGPPVDYWTFPKGQPNEGEDMQQAAIREVREETGITAEIVDDLGFVKFFRNYDKTLKFVQYYLMEGIEGDTKNHDKEIAEVRWFPWEDALAQLKWPADKELFIKVYDRFAE